MNIRQLERRVREAEKRKREAAEEAERDWERRFVMATLQPIDTELDELTRTHALLQAQHGIDSPEAKAEFDRIRKDFERIIEERYSEFLDGPME